MLLPINGCTSLTTAPELSVMTLAVGCYSHMFADCTSLTSAPELPATTLSNRCYRYMFNGCTNLNYIKCLATDISAYDCTGGDPYYPDFVGWVNGVSSTGTFVKHPSMTGWSTGVSGFPTGWMVVDAEL